jgi:hypothetical protein
LSKSEKSLHLVIGDLSLPLAQSKTENHPNATAIALDILMQSKKRSDRKSRYVISMLPAHLHIEVEIVLCTKSFGHRFLC